jgi:hypothetical protein
MAYTTIDNPELYFQVKLYTGNGTDDTSITLDGEEDMAPNLIWFNCRSHAEARVIHDSPRGVHERLFPGATDVEAAATNALQSFDSNGWTMGVNDQLNSNTKTYVAWCWKAGTTSGITTNASTTITPSAYSFNQTAGISILKHTGNSTNGAKMAHGLGAIPHMMIFKNTLTLNEWAVYHHKNTAAPETDGLRLNETAATADDVTYFYDTAPDSVNITFGNSGATNDSTGGSNIYASWHFTGIQGYSKFGGYEGNGNADGAFVYTGFRPAFVMTKSIDSTSEWHIFDDQREGFNRNTGTNAAGTGNDALTPEGAAELTTDLIDIVSNGFKCRTSGDPNVAETYVYAAFAKAPFVNSNGVPCNGR